MAKVTVRLPDEALLKLSRLGEQTDQIAERVLEAGAEVVVAKVRSNLESVIGKNIKGDSRSTGQLVSALGVSPVKVNRDGNHDIKIGFSENSKRNRNDRYGNYSQ